MFLPQTLGELKATSYQPKSIKEELRDNLISALQAKKNVFEGIYGYEDTVIPQIERAILSMHNINLLGLRGQAKTRIARLMTRLLDAEIPVVAGSPLNDDPLNPISHFAKNIIQELGDKTPIAWLKAEDRYSEKLATPDVSVADLIGDIDPIKAATERLSLSDERVLHYGMIPRSNRCIFVINELPDLQARIQVALFNILQEGDIQIRGFKMRLPLDIQFVFTANPEDYTNRGSIVTPLKDRIDSQIITHYPESIEIGKKITAQEARVKEPQVSMVSTNEIAADLIEQIALEARNSQFVDVKSGVSARLTISAYENMLSAAERRALRNQEKSTRVRVADIWAVVPSITGKIELVYEGEQEGADAVANLLIGKAIKAIFAQYFPEPSKEKKKKNQSLYLPVVSWFSNGNALEILNDDSDAVYQMKLDSVPGLGVLVVEFGSQFSAKERYFLMELCLHGLAEHSQIARKQLGAKISFGDLLNSMIKMDDLMDN